MKVALGVRNEKYSRHINRKWNEEKWNFAAGCKIIFRAIQLYCVVNCIDYLVDSICLWQGSWTVQG